MRILGVDPGLTAGYGLISNDTGQWRALEHGTVIAKVGRPLEVRLSELAEDFGALCLRLQPDEICVERMVFRTAMASADSTQQARGAILVGLSKAGAPLTHLTPSEWRPWLGISARESDKAVTQQAMLDMLGMLSAPRPSHAADALAIALALARRLERGPGAETPKKAGKKGSKC